MPVAADEALSEAEKLKAQERDAILAIAVDSLDGRDRIRRQLLDHHHKALPTVRDSLAFLASVTDGSQRQSQRVFALQLLVKYAGRQGYEALVRESGGELETFLGAAVHEGMRLQGIPVDPADPGDPDDLSPEPPPLFPMARRLDHVEAGEARDDGGPEGDDDRSHAVIERVRDDDGGGGRVIDLRGMMSSLLAPLRNVGDGRVATSMAYTAAPARAPQPDSASSATDDPVTRVSDALRKSATPAANESGWAVFAEEAGDVLGLRPEEANLPECSDEEEVAVSSGSTGIRTIVQFTTDLDASDFHDWTDPRRWASDCSLFFKSVTPAQELPASVGEFSNVLFNEVVAIDGDPANDMRTPLLFSRRLKENFAQCRYILPANGETAKLSVDEGMLRARTDPHEPDPKRRTVVTAEKIIKFVDPALEDWPTLLCDLWWLELTITVALGCAQGHS